MVGVYNLGFETPNGVCNITGNDQVRITVDVEAGHVDQYFSEFYIYVRNAANTKIKKFQYQHTVNGLTSIDFVTKAESWYAWRTPLFSLPPGTYNLIAFYPNSNTIPPGKYYASEGEYLVQVVI